MARRKQYLTNELKKNAGVHTSLYFAAHASSQVRWAIAGRDETKLASVKQQIEKANPSTASVSEFCDILELFPLSIFSP